MPSVIKFPGAPWNRARAVKAALLVVAEAIKLITREIANKERARNFFLSVI